MFTTKLFLTWHSSPWELHKTSQGSLQTLKFHTIWSLKLKTDGTFKISGLTQKLGTKAQAKESSLSIGGLRSAFEDHYMIRLSLSSSSWWQIKAQEFQLLHKKLLHNYSNSCLILPPPPNVSNLIITNTIRNPALAIEVPNLGLRNLGLFNGKSPKFGTSIASTGKWESWFRL